VAQDARCGSTPVIEQGYEEAMNKCCLCGTTIETPKGYDADPVAQGRCCKACFVFHVLPARASKRRREPSEADLRKYREAMEEKRKREATISSMQNR
jgi:hypothetical protein